jgi:hypothetical protein
MELGPYLAARTAVSAEAPGFLKLDWRWRRLRLDPAATTRLLNRDPIAINNGAESLRVSWISAAHQPPHPAVVGLTGSRLTASGSTSSIGEPRRVGVSCALGEPTPRKPDNDALDVVESRTTPVEMP